MRQIAVHSLVTSVYSDIIILTIFIVNHPSMINVQHYFHCQNQTPGISACGFWCYQSGCYKASGLSPSTPREYITPFTAPSAMHNAPLNTPSCAPRVCIELLTMRGWWWHMAAGWDMLPLFGPAFVKQALDGDRSCLFLSLDFLILTGEA